MRTFEGIEIGLINLRYAHTRIRSAKAVLSLSRSIERFGQICPVLVVPGQSPEHILIDGYLRVEALRRCGADHVNAQIWPNSETDALIHALANCQMREWDMFEEACLLRELSERHEITQGQIAHLLGKDKSWVSRRLSFLTTLPEDIVSAVHEGHLSSWAAHRVLTPLARANCEHAKLLAEALKKEPIATRNLALFFEHYKKANRAARENMVNQPHLFLKAVEVNETKKQAKTLSEGPEGRWARDINTVGSILKRLIGQVPVVFYAGQRQTERGRLLTALSRAKDLLNTLEQTVRGAADDRERNKADDSDPAPVRMRDPSYQPVAESVQKYGEAGYPQPHGGCAG